MLVPTPRFWLLAALGIPVAAFAYQQGNLWLLVAFDSLLIVAGLTSGFLGPAGKAISVRRQHDSVLSVRVSNAINLEIANDGNLPMRFRMRDEPPPTFGKSENEFDVSLPAGGIAHKTYHVTPTHRGSEYFRGTYVRIQCPMGLVERQERLPTDEPLRVYPNVLALREFSLLNQKGRLREMGIRRSRLRGLGTDFESLREYAEGDDYRKIDWAATARRSRLIVRQYETERNQNVLIAIDVGRHMLAEVGGVTKLDLVLDSCLMLAQAAAVAGDNIGLLLYGDRVVRFIAPRKGRNQVGMLVEAIHDAIAMPVETDTIGAFAYLATRWKRRSLIVNFTDSGDESRAKDLATALHPLASRHIVLMARIADPRLREAVESRVDTKTEMYVKAAGLLLDDDRRQATSVLESHGLRSLESEPQDLAADLVSYYFYVKERGLI